MRSTVAQQTSIPVVAGIYMAYYACAIAFLGLCLHFASARNLSVVAFPGVAMPAGIAAAQYWLKHEKAMPARRRAWSYALICGVASTILLCLFVLAGLSSDADWWQFWLPPVLLVNIFFTRLGFEIVFDPPSSISKAIRRKFRKRR